MGKYVPKLGAKIDFNRGFKADAPKPRKAINTKKRLKKVDFKGGFLVDAKKVGRSIRGGWVYSDTRDYRFDPSKYEI
jgi:hypothetical protein